MWRRRPYFQMRRNPELNRALREVHRRFNAQETSVVEGRFISMSRAGGSGAPSAPPSALKAFAGSTIQVYFYKHTDPDNPDTLMGSTTTDAAGYWSFDVASYCWSNDKSGAFLVTIKRDGVVIRHQHTPEHFIENAAGNGYLPILVENRELHN